MSDFEWTPENNDYFCERFHLVTHLYEDHELILSAILNYMLLPTNNDPVKQLAALQRLHALFPISKACTDLNEILESALT